MGIEFVARGLGCAAAVALLLSPPAARAQVARIEYHPFASTTLTDEEFLLGKREGRPVVLAGELRLPPGTGRFPLVILVHGSGGVSGLIDDWANRLNALGVATFAFDSFTPRGIENTRDDQSQLGRLAMIVDAYRALAVLSKHARIAPERIALMGFSRGGQAALYASVKRFQRMHGPADAAFALFIPFYPTCSTRFLEDEEIADRPVRIFHGTDDDYAAVAPCRAYVERLSKAHKDVLLTEYPGAHHLFDWAALRAPTKLPTAQTVRHCRTEEVSAGRVVNVETKQVFTYADPCVERGVTVAYSPEAAAAAQGAVAELVTRVLAPTPSVRPASHAAPVARVPAPPDSPEARRTVALVEKAAALVDAQGRAAFAAFRRRGSEWFDGDTYLFSYDSKGSVLLNPAFPQREGTNVSGQKDANGKLFHDEMLTTAATKGAGWVDYMFPRPGQERPSHKWTYVKRVTIDGAPGLVGSGYYEP